MINMRSTSVTKMAKPPPPIPPRPSKALVAEALAKSRKSPVGNNRNLETTPIRSAPPPPCINNNGESDNNVFVPAVIKSQSFSTLSNGKAKVERSLSQNEDESKGSSRTVVFQSSNLKTSRIQMKLMRHQKHDVEIKNSNPDEIVNKVENSIVNSEDISHNYTNDLLNGKNHVNTLIDEMFASILDNHDEPIEMPEAFNENLTGIKLYSNLEHKEIQKDVLISADKSKILVSSSTCSEDDNNDKSEPEQIHTSTTVLIIDDKKNPKSNTSTTERSEKQVKFDDKMNHELLISELENMRKEQEKILKRQRKPSQEFYDDDDLNKIHHSDWVEVSDGHEVRLSSCQIIINNDKSDKTDLILSRSSNMSLHGLPPLPKSLSGFSLLENQRNQQQQSSNRGANPPTSSFVSGQVVFPPHPRAVNGTPDSTSGRKTTNLDNQLAILRREMDKRQAVSGKYSTRQSQMKPVHYRKKCTGGNHALQYSLRQLDLSLLSQLWSLNESIQDFRQILQEQDDRALSPPSPSPSPSSCDDGETDEYFSPSPMRLRPAPPPPPLRRTSNSSSANSSEYGTV